MSHDPPLRRLAAKALLGVALLVSAGACDTRDGGAVTAAPANRVAYPIRVAVTTPGAPGGAPEFIVTRGGIRAATRHDRTLRAYELALTSREAARGVRRDMNSVDEQYVCPIPPGQYPLVDVNTRQTVAVLIVYENCSTKIIPVTT